MKNQNDSRFAELLKRSSALAWQGLEYRFELFAMELKEERQRILSHAVLAQVALFAGFMSFVCLNVLVFALFWDTNRTVVAMILAGLYLAVALAIAVYLRRRARNDPRPFEATLEELRKDRVELTRKEP